MPMLVDDSPKGKGNEVQEQVQEGKEGMDGSDSGSDGEMPDFGENVCPACMQQFGAQDEDCPFRPLGAQGDLLQLIFYL